MDGIELDAIIMFLRGNIPLKTLLRNVRITGVTKTRVHLKFSLEQLIDLRENARVGNIFRRNWHHRMYTGTRWQYRNILLEMITKGEDITEKLNDFKKILPKTTYYRLKKDLVLSGR